MSINTLLSNTVILDELAVKIGAGVSEVDGGNYINVTPNVDKVNVALDVGYPSVSGYVLSSTNSGGLSWISNSAPSLIQNNINYIFSLTVGAGQIQNSVFVSLWVIGQLVVANIVGKVTVLSNQVTPTFAVTSTTLIPIAYRPVSNINGTSIAYDATSGNAVDCEFQVNTAGAIVASATFFPTAVAINDDIRLNIGQVLVWSLV